MNVLDFGADPSGEADSDAALQSAITEAASRCRRLARTRWLPRPLRRIAARRRSVYMPAGNYTIRNTLNIEPGVTLRGDNEISE